MGQCGCADTNVMFRMPGPPGVTYGIEVYESCHYCITPAGVVIHRFADDSDNSIFAEGAPEAPFLPYDRSQPIDADLTIPLLDPAKLVEAYTDHFGSDEEPGHISDENLRLALPSAVHKTLQEWHQAIAARSVPTTDEGKADGE